MGKYYSIPDLHSQKETDEMLERCVSDGMSAVILCPVFFQDDLKNIDLLHEKGIFLVSM